MTYYGNGNSESQYLAGDFNGDGKDELAVRRGGSLWYQNNLLSGTAAGISYYGGDQPYLIGDWDGNRAVSLAIVSSGNNILWQHNLGDTYHSGVVNFGNG